MIDLNVLNKRGVNAETAKKVFAGDDSEISDKGAFLLDRIKHRIDDGLNHCIKNHKNSDIISLENGISSMNLSFEILNSK